LSYLAGLQRIADGKLPSAIGYQVAGEGFEPSTFGLCIPLQLSLPGPASLWSGLSLHPRTGCAAVRVPAVKSLHLLRRLLQPSELGSGLPPLEASPSLAGITRESPRVQPIAESTSKHHGT